MKKIEKFVICFFTGILVTLMLASFDTPTGAEANERELSLGKIGGDVRQLQMTLTKKGYQLEPFDGIYGLRTQEAVIKFQKKHDLKPTGVVDGKTREALRGEVPKAQKGENVKMAMRERNGQNVSRSFSRKDVIMLARVVHGEARGEDFAGQVAVAAVVLNRTRTEGFPNTIEGVIFQPNAFDAVADGQIWLDPDPKAIKAAELALAGYDPTGSAIYYWNPAKSTNKWIWSRPIHKRIGDHVFAR